MDRIHVVAAVTMTTSTVFLLLPLVFPPVVISRQCPIASHHIV
jgi:hypothetical protein